MRNKTSEEYYSIKDIPLYAIEDGYNDIPEACPNCGVDLHNCFNDNGICKCSCGQLVMRRDEKFYFRRNER